MSVGRASKNKSFSFSCTTHRVGNFYLVNGKYFYIINHILGREKDQNKEMI